MFPPVEPISFLCYLPDNTHRNAPETLEVVQVDVGVHVYLHPT